MTLAQAAAPYGFGTHPYSLTQNCVFIRRLSSACPNKSVARAKREGPPPLALLSKVCPKSVFRALSRPTFCVFALKTRTKTHTHTLTSFRTRYVCHFKRVFRAKTNPCLFVWGVFAFRPKNTHENTHLPPHRFRHQVGVSFQTCFQGESEHG